MCVCVRVRVCVCVRACVCMYLCNPHSLVTRCNVRWMALRCWFDHPGEDNFGWILSSYAFIALIPEQKLGDHSACHTSSSYWLDEHSPMSLVLRTAVV